MPSYAFRIDSMHVDDQRSSINDSDSDWLVFSVKTGLNTRSWQGQVGSGIVSGASLTPSPQNPWLVDCGDMNLGDNDLVLTSFVMTNLSHTDARQQAADALKIAGAVTTALKEAPRLEDNVPVIGGIPVASAVADLLLTSIVGVGAVIGPILGAIGEILGGTDKPNCNGLVFSQQFILSGKQLRDLTKNATSVFSETKAFKDQQSPHECGHNPETQVVFSIVPSPQGFSVKRFLRSEGLDPSRGIRQVKPDARNFSIKSVINQ
jgi:hypothetical protein